MRVLVIEDNRDIAANVGDFLEDKGHVVDFAGDGVTGLHLAVVNDFDAIVLDLTLPGMDGLEVCRKLRQEARKQTPVLMLTARDALEQKLSGFESGADDYLVKPFALQELEARLAVLGRRTRGPQTRVLKVADLEYNLDTLVVTRHLGALPDRVAVIEIEPLVEGFAAPMSQAVTDAVAPVCELALACATSRDAFGGLPIRGLAGQPSAAEAHG